MKKRSVSRKQSPLAAQGVAEKLVPYRSRAKSEKDFLRFAKFEISNFRCFDSFELSPLSLVNLITGMNGVGKTAILEALFLHVGATNPSLALKVNLWRGLGGVGEWTGMLWRNLFWQFKTMEPIRLVRTDSRGKKSMLIITIAPTAAAVTQDMTADIGIEFARDVERDLVFEYKDERGQISTSRGVPEIVKKGNVVQFGLKVEPTVVQIPFPGIFLNSSRPGPAEEDVQRFSDLRISNQDQMVLDVLKRMEPRLEKLEILSPHGASMIHGYLTGYSEPVPLSLLGDGVRRVTSLVLAIGSARGGTILVDEVENGIHHSMMPSLWEAIGKAAGLFHTQVIATTHSLECVSAAFEAFRRRRSYDLTLHRLERMDGMVRAIAYDRESLEGALSIPTEVRG
jgi:hypothetical protein